jgi:hypothetical protein
VSVVSKGEVLVMFVIVDGEVNARKIFRMAQNGMKPEGWVKKTKEVIKNSNNPIF